MRITDYKKIHHLLTAKKIKLYTYQNINTLSSLEQTGYITGEHGYSYSINGDEFDKALFNPPYEWMRRQMKKRINNFSGDLPVWGWVESRGNIDVSKKFGDNQVKITAIVPLSRCLISDFDLYEAGPMNKTYFSHSVRKMEEQFTQVNEEEYKKDHKVGFKYKFEPEQEELEKSWELIFDLSRYVGTKSFREYLGIENQGRYLQVCIDRIYQNEIEHIKVYDNVREKKV